ncbi:hypothetical protein ABEW34_06710 [Paenibacillus algorifonticola]|uniref:tetratricopeptide repeat protein n=1 Tax=Paenibacillus algorifonticola TaxID=684063 RepID=UPI003D2C7698
MFKHMFATMNEMLDNIIDSYPLAAEEQKQYYDEQLYALKQISDSLIEQWIDFEEKFAVFTEAGPLNASLLTAATEYVGQAPAAVQSLPPQQAEKPNVSQQPISGMTVEQAELISKGQGYYQLFMFSHAAKQFQLAVNHLPECNLARLFLAMTNMHLQNWSEAQRHFQLLIGLTDYPKWLALSYNALGCIQAVHLNLEQAEQFFLKAYELDPSFKDPLNNLQSCRERPQQLSLLFGSTELCCL